MNTSRRGIIGIVGVLMVAIWIIASISAYGESRADKLSVTVKPGAVTYGTHSTVTMPVVSVPMRRSVPMISGTAVRSYAYYGHSAMPKTSSSSNYRIYTTSSSATRSMGFSGGGASSFGGTVSSPSATPNSAVVAMPTIAMAMPATTSAVSTSAVSVQTPPSISGLRRMPGFEGEEPGDSYDDSEGHWVWDGEEWILESTLKVGDTKIEGGQTYRWNGSSWELVGDQQDPGLPVGTTPWLLILIMLGIYTAIKPIKNNVKN